MNVAHVTLTRQRFECHRCGTAHLFMSRLSDAHYERKGQLFVAQHADCVGHITQPPLELRPALPPTKASITC
jgi:hypothetical protein